MRPALCLPRSQGAAGFPGSVGPLDPPGVEHGSRRRAGGRASRGSRLTASAGMPWNATPAARAAARARRRTPERGRGTGRPTVRQHPELERAVAFDGHVPDRLHRQEAAAALPISLARPSGPCARARRAFRRPGSARAPARTGGRTAGSRSGATASLTGSLDAMRTSARSARRHTVRATCAIAAARVPPGRMNSLSAPRSALKRSTAASRRATWASVTAAWPGIDSSPPRSKRSCWTLVRHAAIGLGQRLGEQEPQRRIELVDAADRLDARRILRDPRAVAQAGRAGIAGARDDLGEAMAHGRLPCPPGRSKGAGRARDGSSEAVAGQHTRSGGEGQATSGGAAIPDNTAAEPRWMQRAQYHCCPSRHRPTAPLPESP